MEETDNPGIFKEPINYIAVLDNVLKEHLQNSTVVIGTSKTIQNAIKCHFVSVLKEYCD